MKKSAREIELEKIVRQLALAARDVMWCALVWNDHNFTDEQIREHAKSAAKALGFDPEVGGIGGQIDPVNEWMARIDAVLQKEG